MCPNCTFCGKYLKEDFVEENPCKVGKATICPDCITNFKEVLDITEIETKLGYLDEDLNKIQEKI